MAPREAGDVCHKPFLGASSPKLSNRGKMGCWGRQTARDAALAGPVPDLCDGNAGIAGRLDGTHNMIKASGQPVVAIFPSDHCSPA
jgi:hypothetical protein